MDLGLKGKNAIVTASSQGLGKACALELAREGVNVLICGRTRKTLENTHQAIQAETKVQIHSVIADVATTAGREAILSEAQQVFPNTDILITNSGGPPPGPFENHDDEAWDNAHELLLKSTVGLIRGVIPSMKAQKWGRIIAITSQAVKQPVNNLILSNAVRSSVTGLCRTLANELGHANITVNTVMPGYTHTDRLEKLLGGPDNFSIVTGDIPLGRIGAPEEFAAMVAFLASERASYITGTSIPVDGGWIKSLL